jgi:hypothetical protein
LEEVDKVRENQLGEDGNVREDQLEEANKAVQIKQDNKVT